jgi:hypothetical protein
MFIKFLRFPGKKTKTTPGQGVQLFLRKKLKNPYASLISDVFKTVLEETFFSNFEAFLTNLFLCQQNLKMALLRGENFRSWKGSYLEIKI